jgi:hypothetical protein
MAPRARRNRHAANAERVGGQGTETRRPAGDVLKGHEFIPADKPFKLAPVGCGDVLKGHELIPADKHSKLTPTVPAMF